MRPAIQAAGDGVFLFIRVTPKSHRDGVAGFAARGGQNRLLVKVRAAPEDGKANSAAVETVAAALGCKSSSVAIAAGHKDRDKTVLIRDCAFARVAAWLDEVARGGKAH